MRLRVALAAAVEAMAVGPPRGCGYGIHAAQGGEGGLGAETLGIAASSREQGRRRAGPYSEAVHQARAILLVSPLGSASRPLISLPS